MTCWPEEHAAATELISGLSLVPSSVLATIADTGCSLVNEDCESPSEVTTVVTGSVSEELSLTCKQIIYKLMLLEVRYLSLWRRWGYVKDKKDYISKFSNSHSSIFQDWVVLVVSRSVYGSVFVLGMTEFQDAIPTKVTLISLWWLIRIINSADKTKLSWSIRPFCGNENNWK